MLSNFEFELEIQVSGDGDINSQIKEVIYGKPINELQKVIPMYDMVLSELFGLRA